MTTYSLAAYALAVRFLRTKKTIMVEGASDKRVLARMMLDRGKAIGRECSCVVDETAMVSDPVLAGRGSKEKVELVAAAIGAGHDARFNWIVDREWEGMNLDNPTQFSALPASPWGWRTKGHSMENYWLRLDALTKYLSLFFGDSLSVGYFADLDQRFGQMLQLAAAYSFSAKNLNIITRCGEAITRHDLEWTGSDYKVLPCFSAKMAARGVTNGIAEEINSELQKESLRTASNNVLQWLCHGHLGEDMIRACAAHLALGHGVPPNVVEQIERGRRTEKLMSDADFVAQLEKPDVHPLGALLDWSE